MTASHWRADEFREDFTAWVDTRLDIAGITRTGPVRQPRVRPWATILTATTTAGQVWGKATSLGTRGEVGLYAVLSETAPARVLRPLGIDRSRGWLLLPDGGPTLGTWLDQSDPVHDLASAMSQVLPVYAELQRDVAPRIDDLLAAGVADMRPEAIPRRFEEALEIVGAWVDAATAPTADVDRATYARLAGLRPRVLDGCEQLAADPFAATVDHNDLHQWNVLVDAPDGLADCRFYDWGDSVVAHPFASLLVPLSMIETAVGGPTDPRLLGVRDAYLAAHVGDVAPAGLAETLECACWLAKIARCLTWARAMAGADESAEPVEPMFARAPFEALASLLLPGWSGTR